MSLDISYALGGIFLISAVIVAGGKGKRMGQDINKQYIKIGEKEILALTLEIFESSKVIDEIVLVVPEDEIDYCSINIVSKYNISKVKSIAAGGIERQDSVYNGLICCNPKTQIVLIHDGARPFISEDTILKSIECTKEYGACTVGVPVKDTIKVVNSDEFIVNTPDRSRLFAVQTPQTFKYDLILNAHKEAINKDIRATDDNALLESLGHNVKIIKGSYLNIKITTPEDLIFAKAILGRLG
jgi:2-C-methyl-D-erythritol 4-phosphate cytidylyltransferase